jgi:vancomycin permeability regulator SanA
MSWVVSFLSDAVFERLLRRHVIFWPVFWKDMIFSLITIAIIILVQWGILNRSVCWSQWGSTWVHLPQIPEVKTDLMYFIRHTAPWVVAAALVFHLMFCIVVAWRYWDAIRIFIQRDDGMSNVIWSTRDDKPSKTDDIKLSVIEMDGR